MSAIQTQKPLNEMKIRTELLVIMVSIVSMSIAVTTYIAS